MPSFCVVSNCELKYSHSENTSFHKFPANNPDILDLWIKFTGRGPNWRPSRWSSICSNHFKASDFREYCSRKCLKRTAVPTIIMKNRISYETYHISNHLTNNNNNYTSAIYSNNEVADEYGEYVGVNNKCNEKQPFEMTCRLCGERISHFSNDDIGNLDDFGIDVMIRKCLPTMLISLDNDQSRAICSYCQSQLKQFSEFVDRIHCYQRDFINSNCQDYVETNQTHSTDTFLETSDISIKQEPVNVKLEKMDGSNKKPHDFHLKNLHSTYTISNNNENNFHTVTTKVRPIADSGPLNDEYSEKQTTNDREQINNCEIMEIIALNNPVSFIDLAEDDPGYADTKKLKTENLTDIDRRVEVEHAYAAKRVQPNTMKQEISEIANDDSNGHTEHVSNDSSSLGSINSVVTDASRIMTFQSIGNQECSPTLNKKECSLCGTIFESVTDYLRHKTKIHRSTCHRCKRKFTSELVLKNHERHCNRNFSSNNLRRRGKKLTKHKESPKEERLNGATADHSTEALKTSTLYASDLVKFVCSFCYRLFKRAKNFAEHQEIHMRYNHQKDPKAIFTNGLLSLRDLKTIVGTSRIICMNQCDSRLTTDVSMKSEETLTDTQTKFVCGNCDEKFSTFISLRTNQGAEKKFSCSLCPKKFKGISGLKQHISGFHFKIKPFSCPVCHATYSLKGDMQRCRHSRSVMLAKTFN